MFINKHTKASIPGKLTYDVIKWKRTKFILSPHSIVYGNCPKCYRAYPIGIKCKKCHGKHAAVKLYFVKDPYTFVPREVDTAPPTVREAADPTTLSQVLLGQESTFYFDLTFLQNDNSSSGYRPEENLRTTCYLSDLLAYMKQKCQHCLLFWGITLKDRITVRMPINTTSLLSWINTMLCFFIQMSS